MLKQQVATHKKGANAYQQTDVTLKVAVIGPSRCGKTRLANQLSALPLLSTSLAALLPYRETAGVRILHFPANVSASPVPPSTSPPLDLSVSVELWDVSGSSDFEPCWLAVCDSLDGVVLAFDGANKQQLSDAKRVGRVVHQRGGAEGGAVGWHSRWAGGRGRRQVKLTVKEGGRGREGAVANGAGGGGEVGRGRRCAPRRRVGWSWRRGWAPACLRTQQGVLTSRRTPSEGYTVPLSISDASLHLPRLPYPSLPYPSLQYSSRRQTFGQRPKTLSCFDNEAHGTKLRRIRWPRSPTPPFAPVCSYSTPVT